MVDRWYQRIPPLGRGVRSRAFLTLYERAINDVLDALEAAQTTYWVTEGTLIGLLRYGRNDDPGTHRTVDHDVDVMVEVAAAADWDELAAKLAKELQAQGWTDLQLLTTAADPLGRRDKLRGWLRGRHWARTRCDIHSYVVDRQQSVAVAHDDAESYPFQRWDGRLPLGLVHPLGRVRCYERTAPAPRRPLQILRNWNDGEYDHECIALPRRRLRDGELESIVATAQRLDAAGYQSMTEELVRCGHLTATP